MDTIWAQVIRAKKGKVTWNWLLQYIFVIIEMSSFRGNFHHWLQQQPCWVHVDYRVKLWNILHNWHHDTASKQSMLEVDQESPATVSFFAIGVFILSQLYHLMCGYVFSPPYHPMCPHDFPPPISSNPTSCFIPTISTINRRCTSLSPSRESTLKCAAGIWQHLRQVLIKFSCRVN